MAARKKTEKKSESELMEADEPMPQTKLVEAEHTIKYKQPFNVPAPPLPEDDEDDLSMDYDEEEERPKPKKIKLSIREKLKAKLQGSSIGETDQISLRIDRLPYYDANGQTGLQAEREFCSIIKCQIEFITNDEYLAETSKRHGAGMYWFTIRHYKSILASWSHRVGGAPQIASVQSENGSSNPQIVYQQIPNTPAPAVPITKSLKELADVIELVDRIRGNNHEPPQIIEPPQSQISPDVQLASLLMADADLKKKAIVNLLGTKDKETDYIALAIEHGPTIIDAIGKAIQVVVKEVKLPLNGVNHEAPPTRMASPQPQNQVWNGSRQAMDSTPERMQSAQIPSGAQESPIDTGSERVITDPRDELMRIAFEGCARNDPPQVTAGQLTAWCEYVETNYPTHSVWGWMDVFTGQTTEEVITLLQTGVLGETGKQIATMPHAHKWIGELRELLKTEEEEESDE